MIAEYKRVRKVGRANVGELGYTGTYVGGDDRRVINDNRCGGMWTNPDDRLIGVLIEIDDVTAAYSVGVLDGLTKPLVKIGKGKYLIEGEWKGGGIGIIEYSQRIKTELHVAADGVIDLTPFTDKFINGQWSEATTGEGVIVGIKGDAITERKYQVVDGKIADRECNESVCRGI